MYDEEQSERLEEDSLAIAKELQDLQLAGVAAAQGVADA